MEVRSMRSALSDALVSVQISGGLGNQMFQYAAARALAKRLHAPLQLDLSFFDRKRHRVYALSTFALAPHHKVGTPGASRLERIRMPLIRGLKRVMGRRLPTYHEPHFHFDPAFERLQAPVNLVGHFQSPRYFDAYAELVRQELSPPVPTDILSRKIAEAMARSESCALHVRRGDYVQNPKNQALFTSLDSSYYLPALKRLSAGCTVYVFSDDMSWARENLPSIRDLIFVEDNQLRSGLADLWLMTQADHHIIANSSLSWWGAWLAMRQEGMKIAPRRWFVNATYRSEQLIPNSWQWI